MGRCRPNHGPSQRPSLPTRQGAADARDAECRSRGTRCGFQAMELSPWSMLLPLRASPRRSGVVPASRDAKGAIKLRARSTLRAVAGRCNPPCTMFARPAPRTGEDISRRLGRWCRDTATRRCDPQRAGQRPMIEARYCDEHKRRHRAPKAAAAPSEIISIPGQVRGFDAPRPLAVADEQTRRGRS